MSNYVKHMLVGDLSLLMFTLLHLTMPHHPIASHCLSTEWFPRSFTVFQVTNPAFPCSLLHHKDCFFHSSHPAGDQVSWQSYRSTFFPHCPLATTDVSLPSADCRLGLPSSAFPCNHCCTFFSTLLKSTQWSPVLQSICLALSPSPVTTSSHALLFPNLFNTDRVNDETK